LRSCSGGWAGRGVVAEAKRVAGMLPGGNNNGTTDQDDNDCGEKDTPINHAVRLDIDSDSIQRDLSLCTDVLGKSALRSFLITAILNTCLLQLHRLIAWVIFGRE